MLLCPGANEEQAPLVDAPRVLPFNSLNWILIDWELHTIAIACYCSRCDRNVTTWLHSAHQTNIQKAKHPSLWPGAWITVLCYASHTCRCIIMYQNNAHGFDIVLWQRSCLAWFTFINSVHRDALLLTISIHFEPSPHLIPTPRFLAA